MGREKYFFVLNSVSVKAGPKEIRAMVEEYAGERSIGCSFYETEEDDNVTDVVREAVTEGYSLIAASGGDGTVSKVGAALVGTEIPLAIIPTGTANVFAQDLGIPRNVRKSVELVFKEHSFRTVDMMRIWGKYYLLNMGVGLNALMIEDTDHKKKSALGLLAYVITGIKKAFGYQPHTFNLEVDGRKEEIDAAEVLVFNSSALGTSAIHLHRETLVDDGLLDLCILQSRNLWDYIKIFISIFLNRVKQDPKIHHFLVEKDVSMDTEKALKVQADGDLIGTTPVRIEVVPRILKIIIPEQ